VRNDIEQEKTNKRSQLVNRLAFWLLILWIPYLLLTYSMMLASWIYIPSFNKSISLSVVIITVVYVLVIKILEFYRKKYRYLTWGRYYLEINFLIVGQMWILSVFIFYVAFIIWISTYASLVWSGNIHFTMTVLLFYALSIMIVVTFSYIIINSLDFWRKVESKCFRYLPKNIIPFILEGLRKDGLEYEIKYVEKGYEKRHGLFLGKHSIIVLKQGLEILVFREHGVTIELYPSDDSNLQFVHKIKKMIDNVENSNVEKIPIMKFFYWPKNEHQSIKKP